VKYNVPSGLDSPIDNDMLQVGAAVPVVDVTEDEEDEEVDVVGFTVVVEVTAAATVDEEVDVVGFTVVVEVTTAADEAVEATAEAEEVVVVGTGQAGPQEIVVHPLLIVPHVFPDKAQVVVGLQGTTELHWAAGKALEPEFPAGLYSQAYKTHVGHDGPKGLFVVHIVEAHPILVVADQRA